MVFKFFEKHILNRVTAQRTPIGLFLRDQQMVLMLAADGALITLAPIFAAAYATHQPHVAFLVGVAAAFGALTSKACSDVFLRTPVDHLYTLAQRARVGLPTFIGGILLALPFLLSTLSTALYLAYAVLGIELIAIAYIRQHFFNMSFWLSLIQVVFGGALVLVVGLLIGSA